MANEKRPDETFKEYTERLTREYVHQEFPKWLYHPDGRSVLVNSSREQSAYGEWLESPQEAIDARESRDKADSDKFVNKVNAEAAASRKKG